MSLTTICHLTISKKIIAVEGARSMIDDEVTGRINSTEKLKNGPLRALNPPHQSTRESITNDSSPTY